VSHTPYKFLENPILVNRYWLSQVIRKGDTVIDATLGNGKDFVFLADLVGPKGCVMGYDIQKLAIESSKKAWLNFAAHQKNLPEIHFFRKSHEEFEDVSIVLKNRKIKQIQAVVYNLGYLPGEEHNITTQPDTTIGSLSNALSILSNHGIVSIVSYRGHDNGFETDAIRSFLAELNPKFYTVTELAFINRKNCPVVFWLEKRID